MNRIYRADLHHKIYLFGLALLITCIPLSLYMMSIALFIILLNWLLEGDFRNKALKIKRNPAALLFASVFILYAAGYLYSEDTRTALEKIRNTLPILALPLIIATSPVPQQKNIIRLFLLFCLAVMAAALVCLISYLQNGTGQGGNFRDISVFMPHIRFSILIDMAIAILIYYSLFRGTQSNGITGIAPVTDKTLRSLLLISALFLIAFLFFLRSATGILIFTVLMVVFALKLSWVTNNRALRYAMISTIILFILISVTITVYTWLSAFSAGPVTVASLETHTVNGNPYQHDTLSGILENGNYTGLYFCEPELYREWNRRSALDYYETDQRGQPVSSTLKRYLASRGLRKDSAGVQQLTPADITHIEKGLANYKFRENPGVYQRLYETLYEIHIYKQTGFVEHHSFGQRLAFMGNAIDLIRENFWIGSGTGDVYNLMRSKAEENKIAIDSNWEGKPHNQFIFFWLAFGLGGFMWILFCWIYPVVLHQASGSFLFNIFFLIILLSMLVMDTLESSHSVTFFSLFYSLLVFGKVESSSNS